MALTTFLISKASDHLTEKQIQLWLMLFRRLPRYKQYAAIYSDDIEERIVETEGTIKARMLNALMKEIDALGVGEVQIGSRTDLTTNISVVGGGTHTESHSKAGGGRDAIYWSQADERMTLLDDALDVLYDDISLMIVAGTTATSNTSSYGGIAAVGQRDWTDAFFTCFYCGCRTCIKGGKLTCGCR